jgi:hypothetical protein
VPVTDINSDCDKQPDALVGDKPASIALCGCSDAVAYAAEHLVSMAA